MIGRNIVTDFSTRQLQPDYQFAMHRVRAAGLDVLPEEPANPDHPLIKAWAADEPWIDHRLLLTPHSAFHTPESVYDMRFKPGQLVVNYLSEGRLANCVNSEFLVGRR